VRPYLLVPCVTSLLVAACATHEPHPPAHHGPVADSVIAQQQAMLAKNTAGKGFGPQSPRDIESAAGANATTFSAAPPYASMSLCNIHFHQNAEHRGGEFTRYVGNGDGKGHQSGYAYSGQLSAAERQPTSAPICPSEHGGLVPGDTIEIHYVHTTAQAVPGPTLGACLSAANTNPQLRVEAVVAVLVNDPGAANFTSLARDERRNGLPQAVNIPPNAGVPIQYAGSTTGPAYNEVGSPLQVSWSVRPKVVKVDINSVGAWCKGNVYKEDHAHGVRNLVANPELLSRIVP
jgi:hypothetical protein